ncbi:heme-copper oxidase subunit III [Synechococcus sp. PCC 7336]|uniref:cytochrome c oxidase subunit 3 n=1 Tax=Synechococcus sp. PCC 7336 TaxID=195250 RepID=UPI000345A41B|nr:heme-copper oxidase subunit III [Synechococcus sp. PCC 7336]
MQGSTVESSDSVSIAGVAGAPIDSAVAAHPDYRVLGLLTFLASESLMFGGLFATYIVFMLTKTTWPPEGTEVELFLPTINTIILVSSSFVIHYGTKAVKENDIKGLRLWFAATAAMGAVFLGGQIYEYVNLGYGLSTNLFANCFYVMTGFHGLHVFVGILLILGTIWRSRRPGHYSADHHVGVEMAEIYWHFVDIIWIILFTLIYILTTI